MIVLGIETSCDETSVGIVEKMDDSLKVLSSVISTSLSLHSQTGGIIPEIAAREQLKYMLPVLKEAINKAFQTTDLEEGAKRIDAIAVTYGPGLIGSLLVGVETAKTLSYIWQKPLISVNHMLGHIYANWLITKEQESKNIILPALALVISGAHTDLLLLKQHGNYEVLGGTRDDAAGECFDKCARLLGYPYPGGPKISKFALRGSTESYQLPRPMIGEDNLDFSFSGLKTAFFNLTKQHFPITRTDVPNTKAGWQHVVTEESLSDQDKQKLYDLCSSLQSAIVDVLVKKTLKAVEKYPVNSLLLSGGVAANDLLRHSLSKNIVDKKLSISLFAPDKIFCTDNGAMIAAAALFNYKPVNWQEVTVDPQLYY